jgi:alpha-galactosidase
VSLTEIDLKYDNCNVPDEWRDFAPGGTPCEFCPQQPCPDKLVDPYATRRILTHGSKHPECPKDMDWRKSNTVKRYNAMRDAINAQQRPMFYSLCNWGHANVQIWANETGQSWRHSGDIGGKSPAQFRSDS